MDIKQVNEIAKAMKENGLTCVTITEGETTLHLERAAITSAPSAVPAVSDSPNSTESAGSREHAPAETPNGIDFNNITEINSPLVGIYHSAKAPDAEPFVTVGSRVKKGDVLCIIEAMKVMNEICAEKDGEIIDICASNGQVVEYSQVLFKMF